MNFSRLIQSRKLMILPPNAIGLLLLLFIVAGKQPPAQADWQNSMPRKKTRASLRDSMMSYLKHIQVFRRYENRQQLSGQV